MKHEQLVPRVNVNDDIVEIAQFLVESGAFVEKGQDLVELSTSKASVTIQAEASGHVRWLVAPGTRSRTGAPLARFFDSAEAAGETLSHAPSVAPGKRPEARAANPVRAFQQSLSAPAEKRVRNFGFLRLTPAARALLEKEGVSLETLGESGMVTSRRVSELLRKNPTQAPMNAAISKGVPARREPCSLSKLAEIDALTMGQAGNVNSSLTVQLDAAPVFRALPQDALFNQTLLPLVAFHSANLLAKYPAVNSFYDDGAIHFYDRINVGITLDLGQGPKVVGLRETNRLFPVDIAEAVTDYAMKYVQGELTLEDLTCSTFTISDLTAQRISHFQPLINGRQAAILGIGGDWDQPNLPTSLTLVFDHRVLSGLEASRFLNELKRRLLSMSENADA